MSVLNIYPSFLYYFSCNVLSILKDIGIMSCGSLSSCVCPDKIHLKSCFLFMYKLNEYEFINSNNLFILGVTGSALLLIICVKVR